MATMHNFSYLRVMSMGGHFFFQTWICMAMIFEPYRDCYSSNFSPDLLCRSWEYGLSKKWSSIFNRMSGTWSNVQFVLLKHITLICQHDKLPLVYYSYSSDFSPILFALYLNNYLTLRPKTSTYDYYRPNLELWMFWVTWPTCDVI